MTPLVLASRSPQRRGLLQQLGIPFRTVASRYEERSQAGLAPADQALAHAVGKAREVAGRGGVSGSVVLGADTMVVIDGEAIGKPIDAAEARFMLERLGGRSHEVVSAVALVGDGWGEQGVATAHVTFRPLQPAAIDWYLKRGEWRGRAGAYAIQGAGAALVERIEGDYTTVVGLPLGLLVSRLAIRGLAPWQLGSDPGR